jgi:hypothetical protein
VGRLHDGTKFVNKSDFKTTKDEGAIFRSAVVLLGRHARSVENYHSLFLKFTIMSEESDYQTNKKETEFRRLKCAPGQLHSLAVTAASTYADRGARSV